MDVVDNDFFANPRGIVKEDLPSPYLLCVSRMIEEKNLFSLIESFANFKKKNQSNLKLMIIGSGPLENKIKEFIYSLNISDIVIKEFIQNNLLPDLYANAKALILPSIKDTWGLVVNEAMASGIPVIVSDRCGCCDDLVINEVNGWVIKPTIDGIYNALIMLSGSSEGKLKEMGNMSRKIISKFSLNDFNIGFVSMIDYAINNNKKLNFIQKLLISLRIYF